MWDKKRSYTKYNWKKKGVKLTDNYETYDDLYDYYLSVSNCEECNSSFHTSRKYLDHDHKTGYFRNVLCNSCNRIRAVDNSNNYMGLKYISKINVVKDGKESDVYRIQFTRKGMKFFKQVRTNKMSIDEVIELRNKKLIEIDGNLDSVNQ